MLSADASEIYGAINSSEVGDGTWECPSQEMINSMFDRLLSDKEILIHMCNRINELKKNGYYNGGYECVKLAVEGHK